MLDAAFGLPDGEGTWRPSDGGPPVGQGGRSFACKKCWGVRTLSMTDHHGWNDFVTMISGGLLFGREVERPLDAAPIARRRAAEGA